MVKLGRTVSTILFYEAKPKTFENARSLRAKMTTAERKLWSRLRKNQILGYRFRRQHPIFIFIVDFYCHKAKLVIEVDGGVHQDPDQQEYDEQRTYELEHRGLTVLRFTNEKIICDTDSVIRTIKTHLTNLPFRGDKEG